jgi:predicted DNA binding protein
MPPGCSAVFDLGDFCIRCPFAGGGSASEPPLWRVLVPRIVDARTLLAATSRRGHPRPTLVRAGAYRREWGLTGRQELAIRTALELGYFDYPRRASLSAVAGRLGVGRSAALELLRKATTKVTADRFLAEPSVDLPL